MQPTSYGRVSRYLTKISSAPKAAQASLLIKPPLTYHSQREERDVSAGKPIPKPFKPIGPYPYFTHVIHRGRKYSPTGFTRFLRNT
eukprot:5263098-Pleurochrysis_carterae.AAC.1